MNLDIKICGMTRTEDVRAAFDLGADFVGFVFHPPSPRCVTVEQASSILEKLAGPVRAVGVFVNQSPAAVSGIADRLGLWAVQIHGDEGAADFAGFPLRLWRALKPAGGAWTPSPEAWQCERFVLDASVPGRYGGTGVTVDWGSAAAFAAGHRTMLAGGLTADSVAEAVRAVRPAGVDVASGVEERPGIKDYRIMAAFIRRARGAYESTQASPCPA